MKLITSLLFVLDYAYSDVDFSCSVNPTLLIPRLSRKCVYASCGEDGALRLLLRDLARYDMTRDATSAMCTF
jgi:hypothetical protein